MQSTSGSGLKQKLLRERIRKRARDVSGYDQGVLMSEEVRECLPEEVAI